MIRLAKGSADDSKVEEKTDEEKAEEKKVSLFLILTEANKVSKIRNIKISTV